MDFSFSPPRLPMPGAGIAAAREAITRSGAVRHRHGSTHGRDTSGIMWSRDGALYRYPSNIAARLLGPGMAIEAMEDMGAGTVYPKVLFTDPAGDSGIWIFLEFGIEEETRIADQASKKYERIGFLPRQVSALRFYLLLSRSPSGAALNSRSVRSQCVF